ncbi:MAG: M23 family metallopeptidase [Tannerellaceae bacterium]|jgi:hypothetical protein|nr:M23 family metallopeptidase [Tannerellaceae bacterium]
MNICLPLKTIYGLLAVWLTIVLSTCHSVQIYAPPEKKNVVFPVSLPELSVATYRVKLSVPAVAMEELEIPPPPEVDITQDFCSHDINHVASTDPKLFAHGDRLLIDLLRLQKGNYSFPLPGAKVISPYGGRRRGHSGTDLKTFAGDTIRAVFDGIVRMAKPYAGYGNVIVIRHFNGLETVYSHNAKHLTKQGERVSAGQPIALLGRTGRATTDHLHFETRINGRAFDPALLFDMEKQSLQDRRLLCTKQGNRIDVSPVDAFVPLRN